LAQAWISFLKRVRSVLILIHLVKPTGSNKDKKVNVEINDINSEGHANEYRRLKKLKKTDM